MSFVYSQTPIIRLMQSREYKTPKFWWRDQVTHSLRTYLADDASTPAYKNNNFDAWRDDVMTVAVTLDDNGADVSAFRLDIVFDNDIFTWAHDSTHVQKGAHITGWTEGDNALSSHYSYEVVHYANVGYTDGIASNGSEKSAADNHLRHDRQECSTPQWLDGLHRSLLRDPRSIRSRTREFSKTQPPPRAAPIRCGGYRP